MRTRILIGFLILALVNMSCIFGGGTGAPSPDSPAADSDIGKISDVIGANPSAPGNEEINAQEMALRSAVREPLRAELGDEADRVFQQMDAAFAATAQKLRDEITTPGRFGLQQSPALTGVVMLTAIIPELVKNLKDGSGTQELPPFLGDISGTSKITLTKSGTKISGEIVVPLKVKTSKGSYSETATGKLETNLCPDTNGDVPLTLHIDFKSELAGGNEADAGALLVGASVDVTATAHVNDEANLNGIDFQTQYGRSVTGQGSAAGKMKDSFVEIKKTFTVDLQNGLEKATVSNETGQVSRASSKATAQDVASAAEFGNNIAFGMSTLVFLLAQKNWQEGYCVELVVEGAKDSNTLLPNGTKNFTAKVRHKWEGNELNAGVKADLQGEKSIQPTEKKPAPVGYLYTAPPEEKQTATLTLETRSKRGAAKKILTFKTQASAWKVDGMLGDTTVTGQICGTDSPFTLTATPPNLPVEFQLNFTPENENQGSLTVSGGGEVDGGTLEMTGSGTYHFEGLEGDTPELVGEADATLTTTAGGLSISASNGGAFRFTLTKLDAAGCGGN